ncbi:MAG: hypothetical protein U1F77_02150 [Kiritimatiellia bacterium]
MTPDGKRCTLNHPRIGQYALDWLSEAVRPARRRGERRRRPSRSRSSRARSTRSSPARWR